MNNLTGIILAGGRSSRLGYPKYQAELNGKTLLEVAISKLEPLCQEIIIVSKESIETNKRNVVEQSKEFHPLIGIVEGLKASKNDANIVLACDMPFVSPKMILNLIPSISPFSKGGLRGISEIRLYRYKNHPEPLLGFYRKSCLEKISNFEFRISNEKHERIIDALAKCDIQYIDIAEECIDFFNINTEEDLIEAQKLAQNNPELLRN